jgi:hypothetical protein
MNPQVIVTTDNRVFRTSFSNLNPTSRGKGTIATDWCDHCKRAGHKADRCWILHLHLRPSRTKAERGGARKGGGEPCFFGGVSQQTGTGILNQNQQTNTSSKPAVFMCDPFSRLSPPWKGTGRWIAKEGHRDPSKCALGYIYMNLECTFKGFFRDCGIFKIPMSASPIVNYPGL